MTEPRDLILAFLGTGPASRMALIGKLLGRGYSYAVAEIETGKALMELVKAGRVESFSGDCWRLSAGSAVMEGDK